MSEYVPVIVPCSCPEQVDSKGRVTKPVPIHPEDTVYVNPVLDGPTGKAAMIAWQASVVRKGASMARMRSDMEGALSSAWLHFGIRDWTFLDEDGQPLPLTPDNIDARLTWAGGAELVAEKCDELYAGDLFGPLVRRLLPQQPTGPTDDSTSPTPSPGDDPESPTSDKPSLRAVTGGKRSAAKAS